MRPGVIVAGLSTGHMIGLTVVAAVFIAFALASSFLIPRYKPDYPGKAGMSVFVIASLVLFAGMLTAVELFGGESETATAAEHAAPSSSQAPATTIRVDEKEFTIVLPAGDEHLSAGTYRFEVRNVGTVPHDLAVQSEAGGAAQKTALIQPGASATLEVTLEKGVYDLFCTVPGHRQAGMETKVSVP